MKQSLIALALISAFSAPVFADEAPASPHRDWQRNRRQ